MVRRENARADDFGARRGGGGYGSQQGVPLQTFRGGGGGGRLPPRPPMQGQGSTSISVVNPLTFGAKTAGF